MNDYIGCNTDGANGSHFDIDAIEERAAIQSVEADEEWNRKHPDFKIPEEPDSHLSFDGMKVKDFMDVQACDPQWILHQYLPRGFLTLHAGDGGSGKTKSSIDLACAAAMGSTFLGQPFDRPMKSLLYLGESVVGIEKNYIDARFKELKTRPAHRINVVTEGLNQPGLMKYIQKERPDIVIIDPITHLQESENGNNNITVERDLMRLATPLAASLEKMGDDGPAMIVIHHLKKDKSSGNPTDMVLGAVKYTAVARMVWSAGAVDSKVIETEALPPDTRALCRVKSNLGPSGGGQYYSIPYDEKYALIEWGEVMNKTAGEALCGMVPVSRKRDIALYDVVELVNGLANGEMVKSGKVVDELANTHSERTIQRAINEARKGNFIAGGRSGYRVTQTGMSWLNNQRI